MISGRCQSLYSKSDRTRAIFLGLMILRVIIDFAGRFSNRQPLHRYARRAVKHKNSCKPLEPIARKMNEMAQKYYDTSRPAYCARHRFVDQDRLSARYRADALTHPVAGVVSGDSMDPFRVGRVA